MGSVRPSRRRATSVLVSALALCAACGEPSQEARRPEPREGAADPRRILTLAPSIAEIAFELGLGDRVAGVGDYVHFPSEATVRPRLGGLINPNLEAMVRLDPDLAILLPSEQDIGRPLQRLGVEVLTVPSESIADLEEAVLAIGRRCGVMAAAEALRLELRTGLAPRDLGAGRSVMIVVGRPVGRPAEILVAGPGTFLDELLERLGAVNTFHDAGALYPQISLEQVLARSPDLILELHAEEQSGQDVIRRKEDWQRALAPVAGAVKVAVISGDWTLIPGPRLPRLYQAMSQALEQGQGNR